MIIFLTAHCAFSDCRTSRTSASLTSSVTLDCGAFGAAFKSGGAAAAVQRSKPTRRVLTSANLNTLDDHGNPLPPADAGCSETVTLLRATRLVQNSEQEPRDGRAERMSERDRAAVDVQLFLVDVELFGDC